MTTELAQGDGTEGQVRAISALPRDLAIIKMENENMMALAAAHPRDYGAVLADIKGQLQTFKSFAEMAMYNKPVGKGQNNKMKYARGLSIRAAEAIAVAYRDNQCRTITTPLADGARVEATFVDYQTRRKWQKSAFVSKRYKKRGGGIAVHNDDRFYDVVCEAAGSKLLRECILRCVPPGLRSELEKCVDEQLDDFLDESTAKKIVAQFSTKGIAQEQIETLLGKRLDSFTKEDRRTLLGTWNAIDQGETTIAEVFGDNGNKKPEPAPEGTKSEQLAKELAPTPEAAADLAPVRADILDRLMKMPPAANAAIRKAYGANDAAGMKAIVEAYKTLDDLNDLKLACVDAAGKAKQTAKGT